MPIGDIDHSNTVIYRLFCKDACITDVYVGHTTNFTQRKYHHKLSIKSDKKFKFYDVIRSNGGWENWKMEEIARYCCANAVEAKEKEKLHYQELVAKMKAHVDKPELSDNIDDTSKEMVSILDSQNFVNIGSNLTSHTKLQNEISFGDMNHKVSKNTTLCKCSCGKKNGVTDVEILTNLMEIMKQNIALTNNIVDLYKTIKCRK